MYAYLRKPRPDFQPSNVVFSMFPPIAIRGRRGRKERREALAQRALDDLASWACAPAALRQAQPAQAPVVSLSEGA